MNYVKFAAVVFVLYFLGYILGPTIAPMLVSEKKDESQLVFKVEHRGAQYTIDLEDYDSSSLPETVKIVNPTSIPTQSGEGEVPLKKGDVVNVINRKESKLIVEVPSSNGKGKVEAEDTDLFMILAARIYDLEAAKNGGGTTIAKVQPQPQPKPDPNPVVVPPKPAPDVPVAKVDPPEPVMPDVKPEPTPPDPGPAPATTLTDEQIVELMKQSISGGALKEFQMAQVKGWKANGEETIDGTTYQTGMAAYDAKTIFGVRSVQAKALIKGGKLERWVFAKSGMEIQ